MINKKDRKGLMLVLSSPSVQEKPLYAEEFRNREENW